MRRLAKLGDGPVGGVALGDVVGPGVVDEALRQRGRQHELSLCNGDEAVAQAVEPELRAAGLADAAVEMVRVLYMAGGAGWRGKHPVPDVSRLIQESGLSQRENLAELTGDGQAPGATPVLVSSTRKVRGRRRCRRAPSGASAPRRGAFRCKARTTGPSRIAGLRTSASMPVRPAGQDLGGRRDLAACLAVKPAAAGKPEIDRVAQPVMVDAWAAVDRAQQRHRPVGRRPSVIGGDAVEARLDVSAGDAVQGPVEPVARDSG